MTYLTLHRPVANPFKFYNSLFTPFFATPGTQEYRWRPSADISETDDSFEVRAELPGVTKDDVHISVKDNLLTIKGEKRQEKTDDSKDFHRVERSYGSFERKFTLPPKVEVDSIKAEFKDGVLTLSIPKPEEVKPKEIPIVAESTVDIPQES
ncbi:MAG: Hsp20/alpha crystallin family protein [Candidatus Poribacteria bacterium]|nr:Hsp20/alpha crystallin family protein [Candidatus Poribacteria bacterium]